MEATNAGGSAGGMVSGTTSTQVDLKSTGGPSGPQNASATGVAPAAVNDWTSSLPDSQKVYVSKKGFKDPSAVLQSYQHLESLTGLPPERIVKLPSTADAPEWGEVYDRLGRPKAATDYNIPGPKDAKGNTIQGNPEFTQWAQKQFHDLGLTKAQGEALATKWNEYAQGDQSKIQATQIANTKADQMALTKEWGAAYDQNVKAAHAAARQFGLGQDEVSQLEKAIGYGKTIKFLASIGTKVGEDSFVTGETGGGGFKGALTPEMAQAQIADLRNDKDFTQRYLAGDAASAAKMKRLMEFAYPDLPQG